MLCQRDLMMIIYKCALLCIQVCVCMCVCVCFFMCICLCLCFPTSVFFNLFMILSVHVDGCVRVCECIFVILCKKLQLVQHVSHRYDSSCREQLARPGWSSVDLKGRLLSKQMQIAQLTVKLTFSRRQDVCEKVIFCTRQRQRGRTKRQMHGLEISKNRRENDDQMKLLYSDTRTNGK